MFTPPLYSASTLVIIRDLLYNNNMTRKDAIKKLRLLTYNPKQDPAVFRALIDKNFSVAFLPNHVERKERTYGDVLCDVLYPEIFSTKRILLYVHGGSFVGGSKAAYREFCCLLANKAFTRVVVPEYTLAPNGKFPKAIEDIQRVFHFLYTEESVALSLEADSPKKTRTAAKEDSANNDGGKKRPEFIIASDGAGSNIALAFLQSLEEDFRRCIKKVVLFCPWLNLSNTGILGGKRLSDEVISTDAIRKARDIYAAGADYNSPLLSPCALSEEALKDFPSVYMQLGAKEILLQDARAFGRLLQKSGVSSFIDVFPEMPHLFQLASDYFTESHEAINRFSAIISGLDISSRRQTYENKPPLENSIYSEA